MAKTLLFKLAETVDNPNLPYLGEIRVQIKTCTTPTAHKQYFKVRATEDIPMEITGTGYFTDSTLTQNLGKTYTMPAGEHTMYVANGDSTLSIRNKYAIQKYQAGEGWMASDGQRGHWIYTLEQFFMMPKLYHLEIFFSTLTGDLSALSTSPLMQYLLLPQATKITGDLSSLAGMTDMRSLNLQYSTGITGNISNLAGMTQMTQALFAYDAITGNTSSIASLHPDNGGKLATLDISHTGVTGTWPPSA